jgi:GTP-binding protein HflX
MLEALGRRRVPQDRVTTLDVLEILAHLAQALRREVGVLVDRHGVVSHVVLSRRWQALVEELSHRSGSRGSALRYLEAHPQADGRPDDGDTRALRDLDLDLVLTIGTQRGRPTEGWVLAPVVARNGVGEGPPLTEGPYPFDALAHLELTSRARHADAARRGGRMSAIGAAERAVLVIVADSADPEAAVEEMSRLAETAGAVPVVTIMQRRSRPDPARFIGKGKVEEVVRATETHAANVVLVDAELSATQQRTLEREIGVKVVDRTALVLDIFARRAQTHEGRLQVELAQMQYLLPRLAGRGVWLSRLGGGIGTRGPGETKLEVDRRRIRTRITNLQREIETIRQRRSLQREPREAAGVPQVALVGYTNAGKSTLLNALTGAGVFVENRLFATLDPTVRRLVLPNRRAVVLADTVGFIQRLPTQLVAAFRGTLEEVVSADLLLHVIDASHPAWPEQAKVVGKVLHDIGAGTHPVITVFNKVDRLGVEESRALAGAHRDAVLVSAVAGRGLQDLLRAIGRRLPDPWIRVRVRVPYREAKLLARLRADGRMLSEDYQADCVLLEAEVPGPLAVELRARGLQATAGGGRRRSPSPR